jgi:hypothetical protein
MDILEEARVEQEKTPMSAEQMLKESNRLSRYGARQAKKLGIKPKDIDRLVHNYRTDKQA